MRDALITLYRNGSLLGVGVAIGWVLCWLVEISSVFGAAALPPVSVTAGVVLLAAALLFKGREALGLRLHGWFIRTAPLLCAVFCLLWGLSPLWLGSASVVAAAVCVIVGAVLAALYGGCYGRLALVDGLLLICVSWAIASCILAIYLCLPPALCPWLMLAMIWGISVLLERNNRLSFYSSQCSESRSMEMPTNPSFTRQDGYSTVSIVFYAVGSGMVVAALEDAPGIYFQMLWGSLAACVLLVFIAFYTFAFRRTMRLMFVWHGVEIATVVCCLLLISGTVLVQSFAGALFSAVFALYPFQVWMKAVTYCKRMDVQPLRPFLLLFGSVLASLGCGCAAGQLLRWVTGDPFPGLFCAIVLVMFSVVAFFYSRDYGKSAEREPAVVVGFSDKEVVIADDVIDASIQRASQQLGFTRREQEVLRLICQGRTMQFTADDLGISINTVRGHMKRIYGKLNVHSREEMLDVLERFRI